jgi:uncharacterized protein YybS (DUF2232 family)
VQYYLSRCPRGSLQFRIADALDFALDAMNGTRDTSQTGTTDDGMDPRDAAALLDRASREARRSLKPWLLVMAPMLVVNFVATTAVVKRATTGVHGRSRLRGTELAAMAVAWVAVFVVMGALAGIGLAAVLLVSAAVIARQR